MKNLLLLLILALFCSCERSCQQLDRSLQTTSRDYEIIVYSGGRPVFHDEFRGIINDSENSDGIYYYKGDTLVEISGDYIYKSLK